MTKTARAKAPAGAMYVSKTSRSEKKAAVNAAISEIYKQHGVVNQTLLVEYGKPASSPIHDQFEWDDRVCGEQYRLDQALQMIMASKFVVLLNLPATPPLVAEGPAVRKLLPTFQGEGFKMRYEVLEEKDTRAQFIELKKKQLKTWCRETIDVVELSPIRAAILALL